MLQKWTEFTMWDNFSRVNRIPVFIWLACVIVWKLVNVSFCVIMKKAGLWPCACLISPQRCTPCWVWRAMESQRRRQQVGPKALKVKTKTSPSGPSPTGVIGPPSPWRPWAALSQEEQEQEQEEGWRAGQRGSWPQVSMPPPLLQSLGALLVLLPC